MKRMKNLNCVLVALALMVMTGCSTTPSFTTKDYVVELGDKCVLKTSNFIEEIKNIEKKDIELDASIFKDSKKYTVKKNTVVSKDKEYLDVGTYKVSLSYKDLKKDAKVIVKDTKAPVFKTFNTQINIDKDSKDIDLTTYFEAEDLSEVTTKVTGDVDYTKAGVYRIRVKASDAYKNYVEKDALVVIGEAEVTNDDINSMEEEKTSEVTNETSAAVSKPSTVPSSNSVPVSHTEPSCSHDWVAQTTVIHHDAVTGTEQVCVHEAWDQPVYKTVETCVCNQCGAEFSTADEAWAHIRASMTDAVDKWYAGVYDCEFQELSKYSCGGWHSGFKSVQVDTVHHDAQYETRTYVITPAYDEVIINGYNCSKCGAMR